MTREEKLAILKSYDITEEEFALYHQMCWEKDRMKLIVKEVDVYFGDVNLITVLDQFSMQMLVSWKREYRDAKERYLELGTQLWKMRRAK